MFSHNPPKRLISSRVLLLLPRQSKCLCEFALLTPRSVLPHKQLAVSLSHPLFSVCTGSCLPPQLSARLSSFLLCSITHTRHRPGRTSQTMERERERVSGGGVRGSARGCLGVKGEWERVGWNDSGGRVVVVGKNKRGCLTPKSGTFWLPSLTGNRTFFSACLTKATIRRPAGFQKKAAFCRKRKSFR